MKPLEGRVAAAHLDVVGCGLWVVGCGLWVVGCGLWVGCGLCCGLASALSYNTHFVDHPPPHIICRSNETPAKVSTADSSSYTGEASAGLSRGWELW